MNIEHTNSAMHTMNTNDEEDTLCAFLKLIDKELMPDYKNIKIRENTHERLKSHGNMGESFDDLINRILDDWEEQKEMEGHTE
ncbi:hypothetical protein RH831_11185 [Halodesulfurarchaeum sp. HSR-GB]|uniref:DUF7557 family protein n=1 Tax=Halodesulfurarchaeum sp. HSR-GB TaxID=3074077 RepID=UPI00285E2BFC|nr:hypothetical protein [Halodesulfurarchaeum sp. HSR-GB]MDR5657738.1 hypothetical protein [Halodesulfurarchaeum sp. HSR-GB]